MARIARAVVPGYPHHVTQRGVRSMPVFFSKGDREAYIEFMAVSAERFGLEFWAWCLMRNHVHLLVVPRKPDSLARGIGDAHRRYTRMVNFRQGARGHLFQERFHSYIVQQDNHAAAVGRYIELNPVKARAARNAEEYRWSSAAFNTGRCKSDVLVAQRKLDEITGPWRSVLKDGQDELERIRIELHMNTGRPLGNDRWVKGIERRLDRRLRAMPIGWPKGKARRRSKKKG